MGMQVHRSSWITRDPDEGCAALERAYRRLRMDRPDPSIFSMGVATVEAGPLGFQPVRMARLSAAAANDGTGLIRIGHLTHGRFTLRAGSNVVAGTAAFQFPSRPYAGQWEDLGLATETVEKSVVTEHARALLGRDDFHLAFTDHQPVSAAMATYWCTTVTHLVRDALPNDQAMASPLVTGQLLRSVATALLHTFPSTFRDQPPQAPLEAGAPTAVRRAQVFIDAHLGADIGLAEIAAAARTSPRGLQAAFRRHLDTTPTAYLRTVRMDAARAELFAADPATGVTVAAIAARWGFAHRGRFAAAYRQTYGEPPATTLHR